MYIASIAADVKVHTWPNGQLLHVYKSNAQGFMKSLSWGKDGSWLVLVPSKGPAEVISIKENLKHLHSIQEIQQPTCAAFQNNTKRNIALGTATGAVLVYDIKAKNVRKHFPRAPSTVFKVEYCAKDSFLIAACENGEILLYNSITYNLSSSYKLPKSRTVSNARCHPIRRNLVVGGSQEGVVAVWDIHTSKLKYHNQAHAAPVTDLTFSPLRGDMLVTIGLDRKFNFFDITSNTCIMQKVMDRSSTAIDFCPDGVGLAVALQDGTIQTYDTRQMNTPLYNFIGHGGQIKQLLFQKKPFENSCEFTFSGDKVDMNVDSVQPMDTTRSGMSYDSFGHMFCGDVLPDIPEIVTEASVDEVEDSFMDVLGLNLNSSIQSVKQDSSVSIAEGVKKLLDSKPNLLEKLSQYSQAQLNSPDNENIFSKDVFSTKKSIDNVKAQTCSTPKYLLADTQPISNLSPITNEGNVAAVINGASTITLDQMDIQKIREVVKEEIQQQIEVLKHHMKYEFMDLIAHTRRHFLDLQMSIIKEFVQMEDNFNKLKENIAAEDCFGEDILIQENIRLRHEVQELQNQLLSHNDT